MDEIEALFIAFSDALNEELAGLGCRLRVASRAPDSPSDLILVDKDGVEIGRLPDHADAAIIVAVDRLLGNAPKESFNG